jgi:hypothetical protein
VVGILLLKDGSYVAAFVREAAGSAKRVAASAPAYDPSMSDDLPGVNERDWEFLQTLERRRNQSDSIAWIVPGLAIASEAFLLTIVLRPETASGSRCIAALVGALIIFAALGLFWKSVFNFDLWDAHINEQRRRLHLRGVLTRDDLLRATDDFPPSEQVRRRRYNTRRAPKAADCFAARLSGLDLDSADSHWPLSRSSTGWDGPR